MNAPSVRPPDSRDDDALVETLRARPRRVVLVGNYGAANLGDELLLEIMSHWIRDAGGLPVAISTHPDYTRRVHGIEAVDYAELTEVAEAMASADLLLLAGGGLFQDYDIMDRAALQRFPAFHVTQFAQYTCLATTLGVPVAALAQGVGPLRSEDARAITRDVFERATLISVRDIHSAELLRQIGLARPVHVAPDPGWAWHSDRSSTPPLYETFPALASRRVIAIVLRDWPFESAWEDAFVAAFTDSVPNDWGCLWIDFHQAPSTGAGPANESPIAERIVPRLGDGRVHVTWQTATPREAYGVLAQCDAALTMRMHATLLAHMAGLATVALEYDDKVAAIGRELDVLGAQRVVLGDIGQRLRPAIAAVTGADRDRAFRLDPERIDAQAKRAIEHRALLWHAMAAAEPRTQQPPQSAERWLSLWHRAAGNAAPRVVDALEGRLHREIATRTTREGELATARSEIAQHVTSLETARADLERLRDALVSEIAVRIHAADEATRWRARHDAVLNSRSYRAMAGARWIAARLRRLRSRIAGL